MLFINTRIMRKILHILAIAVPAVLLASCSFFGHSDEELGSKQANRYIIVDTKQGKYGFIDASGEVVIPPQFDDAYMFREGLALVENDGKIGFIDTKGKYAVPPIYEDAEPFSEGLAAVSIDGDHYGFINKNGEDVIAAIYDDAHSFSDGVALVRMGESENGTYMYIDKKGKAVVTPVGNSDWTYYDYKNGIARVKMNDKYGFVDKQFKFVVNPIYDHAYDFQDGLAAVEVNERWGFIDTKGKFQIAPQYEEVGNFHEGLAYFSVGEKYGFLDKKGDIAISPIYDDVSDFHNGVAAVESGNKYGYIDKNGNFIVPPRYDDFVDADGDIMLVANEDDESLNLTYIDKKGTSVWQFVQKFFHYTTGFESSDDNWTLVNGLETNRWVIGSSTSKEGQRSLYISNTDGSTNEYNGSYTSTVFAYKTLNLTKGYYTCEFDWRCVGESTYDYMRVFLVPNNVSITAGQMGTFAPGSSCPDDWIEIDDGYRMNRQSTWTDEHNSFSVPEDGTYKLVFMWHNDGSDTYQTPAAIDNVTIRESH